MKYTNESAAGARRAASYNKPEREPNVTSDIVSGARMVDPSVRLGPLKGEVNGNVPMSVQMAKPQAYQAKKGAP